MSANAEPVVSELISLLSLERLEDNLFRGQSRDIGTKYVFGGQVLGQALSAAQATVENGRQAHSLHAYFCAPAISTTPSSMTWTAPAMAAVFRCAALPRFSTAR